MVPSNQRSGSGEVTPIDPGCRRTRDSLGDRIPRRVVARGSEQYDKRAPISWSLSRSPSTVASTRAVSRSVLGSSAVRRRGRSRACQRDGGAEDDGERIVEAGERFRVGSGDHLIGRFVEFATAFAESRASPRSSREGNGSKVRRRRRTYASTASPTMVRGCSRIWASMAPTCFGVNALTDQATKIRVTGRVGHQERSERLVESCGMSLKPTPGYCRTVRRCDSTDDVLVLRHRPKSRTAGHRSELDRRVERDRGTGPGVAKASSRTQKGWFQKPADEMSMASTRAVRTQSLVVDVDVGRQLRNLGLAWWLTTRGERESIEAVSRSE